MIIMINNEIRIINKIHIYQLTAKGNITALYIVILYIPLYYEHMRIEIHENSY